MTRDDGYTRYTVRIPTPLYERLKSAAGEKSVNAEIVATLEEKYPPITIDMSDLVRLIAASFSLDVNLPSQELLTTVSEVFKEASHLGVTEGKIIPADRATNTPAVFEKADLEDLVRRVIAKRLQRNGAPATDDSPHRADHPRAGGKATVFSAASVPVSRRAGKTSSQKK